MQIKICCIKNIAEANLAISHGATAVGLVSKMPSGPGVISDIEIAQIAKSLPAQIRSFLLTSRVEGSNIAEHLRITGTNTVQLVDEVKPGTYELLRKNFPDVSLVQVIHVIGESSIDYALNVAEKVDFLLLDSGNPSSPVKELGGTGKTHNWNVSAAIVALSPKPVFLAGGLNADNVRMAIDLVKPYGVDVCTGVRTNAILDPQKIEELMKSIFF